MIQAHSADFRCNATFGVARNSRAYCCCSLMMLLLLLLS
jgi:hypothetical protein